MQKAPKPGNWTVWIVDICVCFVYSKWKVPKPEHGFVDGVESSKVKPPEKCAIQVIFALKNLLKFLLSRERSQIPFKGSLAFRWNSSMGDVIDIDLRPGRIVNERVPREKALMICRPFRWYLPEKLTIAKSQVSWLNWCFKPASIFFCNCGKQVVPQTDSTG